MGVNYQRGMTWEWRWATTAFHPSFREASFWADRDSQSRREGDGQGKLKALEYGLLQIPISFPELHTSACVIIWQSRYCSFSQFPWVYNGEKDTGLLWKVFWYQTLENFQEFITTILLMLPLLSFSDLLYWSNDPLILFCWLYRWSFKAAVKCAIKSSRQLSVLIYKQMQPAINRRLKWSNGRASFYTKSYNLSLLSPQLSAPLHALKHGSADRKAASASVAVLPPQTLSLCL